MKKPTRGLASCSLLLTKYRWGHEIKKNQWGEACGMYGREERWDGET